MLHLVSESQKLGGTAAYIDMEHALDPAYAARLGVDINSLYISHRIPANRLSRSQRPLYAPAQSIL